MGGDFGFFKNNDATTTTTMTMGLIVFSVSSGNGDGSVGERVRLLLRRQRMGPPPRRVNKSGARGGVVRQIFVMVSGAAKNIKNDST